MVHNKATFSLKLEILDYKESSVIVPTLAVFGLSHNQFTCHSLFPEAWRRVHLEAKIVTLLSKRKRFEEHNNIDNDESLLMAF